MRNRLNGQRADGTNASRSDLPKPRQLHRGRASAGARIAASVMAASLVATGSIVLTTANPTPAEAVFATGGEGLHKESIDWFDWSAYSEIPLEGVTETNTRVIDGEELTTTCTISNMVGQLYTYRSGNWVGDAFVNLYNVGGTGTSNEMVAGLLNAANGATNTFTFDCAAALNGVPVPLQGLVVADAEASGGSEYISATPNGAATWRIIDRYRSDECTLAGGVSVDGLNTLTFQNFNECNFQVAGTKGPAAVAFMEGAQSAEVVVSGGTRGRTAVALGVVIDTDFGDAPESYGEAGAIFTPTWQGGEVPLGYSDYFSYDLATKAAPELRLGATIDGEVTHQFSPDAMGDDNVGIADEDAVSFDGPIAVTPGSPYTLESVECHGAGFVTGWIDWNGNGIFDESEASDSVECVGESAALTWTVPMDTQQALGDSQSFLRLRIAPDAATSAKATGLAVSGEVEDHAVNIQLPSVAIEKTSSAGASAAVGDTVTYTVRATNTSAIDYTEAYPATVVDDMTGVLDDGAYQNDASASLPGDLSFTSPRLTWTGPLAAGETVELTYTVVLAQSGDGQVRNVAFGPPPGEVPPTPECVNTADGIDVGTGLPCAPVETLLPKLTISKVADTTELPADGDTVTYTVEVVNVGPGDTTASNPARFVDDLSEVLDDGSLDEATIVSSVGSATFDSSANELSWEGVLAVGEAATVSYTVTYDQSSGDQQLVNRACLPVELAQDPQNPCRIVQIPGGGEGSFLIAKSSDPASGSAVRAGDTITYTLTVTHTGNESVLGAVVEDDLSKVLDDAKFNNDVTASSGTVNRDGSILRWVGDLAGGEVVTITYSVEVAAAGTGDGKLVNVVATENPAGACDPAASCSTTHDVPPPPGSNLAVTGGEMATGAIGAAILLLVAGGVFMVLRRQRNQASVNQ